MAPLTLRGKKRLLPASAILFFLLWGTVPVAAQGLALKRDIPGSQDFSCPPMETREEPDPEESVEAGRLGSNADQALILGDRERARDLLARATELDPTSPELAYRYARVLEELEAWSEAITQYCRVLELGSGAEGQGDASERLRTILDRERSGIPDAAIEAFRAGLEAADDQRWEAALRSFDSVWRQAPEWVDALFNRGVARARLGRVTAAAQDLQQYLALDPAARDAGPVSERIAELRSLGEMPSPAGAFTLGLLFPGAGQFYSRRVWGGMTVLTLAASAAAAGFLVEEVTVRCVGSVAGEDECPSDRVIGEEEDNPYLMHGLAAAGAVVIAGAVESFFRARNRRRQALSELMAVDLGETRILGPDLAARGPRVQLSLVQVTF